MIPSLRKSLLDALGEAEVVIKCILRSTPGTQQAIISEDRVGVHIRHVLDHIEPLLSTGPEAVVDYGVRRRDSEEERSLDLLTERVRRLSSLVADIEHDCPLIVRADVGFNGKAVVELPSSLARELQFVMSHAVHHLAIARLLLAQRGVELPVHIGVAPETRRGTAALN